MPSTCVKYKITCLVFLALLRMWSACRKWSLLDYSCFNIYSTSTFKIDWIFSRDEIRIIFYFSISYSTLPHFTPSIFYCFMQLYLCKSAWICVTIYPNHDRLKDVEAFLRSNLCLVIFTVVKEAENFNINDVCCMIW